MRKLSSSRGSLEPVWPRAWERPAACGPSSQAFLGQRCPLDPVRPQTPSECSKGGAGLLGGSWWSSDHRPGSPPPLLVLATSRKPRAMGADWDNHDGLFLWDCIRSCLLSLEGCGITRGLGLKKLWWQATEPYQGKTTSLFCCFWFIKAHPSREILFLGLSKLEKPVNVP